MKLIKEIESRRDNKGKLRKWGKFLCPNPICNKIVERDYFSGLKQKSCGCIQYIFLKGNKFNYQHGGTGSRLFNIWRNIKTRCSNKKSTGYKDYGGRGITICPEWTDKLNGFINFRDWALNNGYADNLEIDRKNTNGNYKPSNCEWITKKENVRKRNSNKIKNIEEANKIRIKYNSGCYTQKELAEECGISISMISNIINNKMWG